MLKQPQDYEANTSDPDMKLGFLILNFKWPSNKPFTLLEMNQYREILYSISLRHKGLANKYKPK